MSAGRVSPQKRPTVWSRMLRLLVSEGMGPVLVVDLPLRSLLQSCAAALPPEGVAHHSCCRLSPPGSFVPSSLSSTLGVAWGLTLRVAWGSSPIVSVHWLIDCRFPPVWPCLLLGSPPLTDLLLVGFLFLSPGSENTEGCSQSLCPPLHVFLFSFFLFFLFLLLGQRPIHTGCARRLTWFLLQGHIGPSTRVAHGVLLL